MSLVHNSRHNGELFYYLTNPCKRMKQFILVAVATMLTVSLYFSYQSLQTIQALNNRVNRANVEYQFVISDSAQITVFDHNRYVGTVKLEGQLDSLMIADNE